MCICGPQGTRLNSFVLELQRYVRRVCRKDGGEFRKHYLDSKLVLCIHHSQGRRFVHISYANMSTYDMAVMTLKEVQGDEVLENVARESGNIALTVQVDEPYLGLELLWQTFRDLDLSNEASVSAWSLSDGPSDAWDSRPCIVMVFEMQKMTRLWSGDSPNKKTRARTNALLDAAVVENEGQDEAAPLADGIDDGDGHANLEQLAIDEDDGVVARDAGPNDDHPEDSEIEAFHDDFAVDGILEPPAVEPAAEEPPVVIPAGPPEEPPDDGGDHLPPVPGGWTRYLLPPRYNRGYLMYDHTKNCLAAHCRDPRHKQPCRLTRTLNGGSKAAAGRPLGQLLAWLRVGPAYDTKELHFEVRRKDHILTWGARSAERQFLAEYAVTHPECAGVFERERIQREGERDEPLGFAG
jgi:hypothetical protein